jgi:glycosyltransferase involved in cell wall biosynthesis
MYGNPTPLRTPKGMEKPRVFLLVPNFQPNDAVGNDVLGMYNILRGSGYDVRVLAEHIHHEHASITTKVNLDAREFWDDRAAILIYHHAIEWQLGEQILAKSRNKIVIKYHNISPPGFYANYNAQYYGWCIEGQNATRRMAKGRIDFVWGDSLYNTRDFIDLGFSSSRCRVIPPAHRIEDLGRAPLDAVITGAYRGEMPNILFVGAFRPNKGHFKALDVLAAHRRVWGRQARLFFVGSFDSNLEQYVREVEAYARQLELESSVSFHRSATMSQLRSYYTTSSVFLCVSEHEGFCVPLVEAMYFRVPIVAWGTTAVGETCDNCGLVYDEFEPEALAGGIEECIADPVRARTLAARGRRRYETVFHPDAIDARLLSLLHEVSSMQR